MYNDSPITLEINTQLVKSKYGEIDVLYNVVIERSELYNPIRWIYVSEFMKIVINKIQNKQLTQLYNDKKLIMYKKEMLSISSLDEIDSRTLKTIYISSI